MTDVIESKINQLRLLTAELKQLGYDFDKSATLQEKVAIHNMIVAKSQERQKNEEELRQIRNQNKIIKYSKIRKTKRRE